MISQMLFGELCVMITKKHNDWCRVTLEWDGYEGWVDRKQLRLVSKSEYLKLMKNRAYTLDLCAPIYGDHKSIPVLLGSSLPNFDGISLKMGKQRLRYSGQTISPEKTVLKAELLRKIAFKYLSAPYLWGGRSPFGLDCSGYVQNVFKLFGIRMPRDAYQQATIGDPVDFIQQSKLGDLAFFSNEEGKIIHVGIILEDGLIIHASGEVRVDRLDHFGIYNAHKKRYSHFLRVIKRVVVFGEEGGQITL